jgi:hypothetical protein
VLADPGIESNQCPPETTRHNQLPEAREIGLIENQRRWLELANRPASDKNRLAIGAGDVPSRHLGDRLARLPQGRMQDPRRGACERYTDPQVLLRLERLDRAKTWTRETKPLQTTIEG